VSVRLRAKRGQCERAAFAATLVPLVRLKLQSPVLNSICCHMLQRTFAAGFIAPCLPTKTDKLPSGRQWLHEIKHDGYRLMAFERLRRKREGRHVLCAFDLPELDDKDLRPEPLEFRKARRRGRG
jgi:ATP-dependent DNA ligase